MEPKTYRATANGYVDDRYVVAGELFTTAAPRGSWMQPVNEKGEPIDDEPPAKKPPAPK